MKRSKSALAVACTLMILAMSGTCAVAEPRSHEGEEFKKILSFLNLMENYLTVSQKWVKMVSDKETTIYFVAERIFEIYKQKGDKADAVPELRKILSKYKDDQTIRNVIHFKIAEIYKDTGRATKAIEELNAIIEADQDR